MLGAEVFFVGVDLAEDCIALTCTKLSNCCAKGSCAQVRTGSRFHWPTHCQSEMPCACHWMKISPIHVPVLEHKNPLGFIRTGTPQLNSAPNFNMQASFTYTPLKPTVAVCKGRKRLVVSRHSLLAEKNAKTLASLEPLHQISRCCSKQCFKQFDNIENLKQLRDTFFNFSNATLRKKFLKDLLLPDVPESRDYMDKHFEIGSFPICYMYAHKLFGVSNNLLTSLKAFLCRCHVPRL